MRNIQSERVPGQRPRHRGQHATLAYYNSRIADAARCGDVIGAEELLTKMCQEGLQPTRCTFNTIINAQKVRGDMKAAEQWVRRLLESGVHPTVVTFTTMISGYAQTGDIARANRWFQLLRQANCKPTEHTFNALIYAHCQAADLAGAEEHLRHYLWSSDERSKPSIVVFNTLIHACGKLGRSDRAIYWFREVIARGLVPSQSTFCAVLNALAEVGAYNEIQQYSVLMAEYGLPVADIGYSALLKACARHGDVKKAEKIFEHIVESGNSSAVGTFNTMIHACTQNGDIEQAERCICIMEEKGVEPCVVTYNSVINTCAGSGDTARAEMWLSRMISKGLVPNEVTYGTLCKAFARQGDVEKVQRILKAVEATGCPLNEYFFASLISACGMRDPPDTATAEEAFADFVRRGFKLQRVRRVLSRVVGERRAAQLLNSVVETSAAKGNGSRPRTQVQHEFILPGERVPDIGGMDRSARLLELINDLTLTASQPSANNDCPATHSVVHFSNSGAASSSDEHSSNIQSRGPPSVGNTTRSKSDGSWHDQFSMDAMAPEPMPVFGRWAPPLPPTDEDLRNYEIAATVTEASDDLHTYHLRL